MESGLPVLGVVGVFLLVGTALTAAGLVSLLVGYRIRSSEPDSTADAVAGGPVDLEGDARPHEETLDAPFSGRECLGYEYEVEEYEYDGDGSNWTTKDSGDVVVPFLLEGDGTVLVDPEDASVDIGDDRERVTVDGGTEPPERIRQFVEENDDVSSENRSLDLKVTEVSYGDKRRYTEHVLLPGETTFVSGVARGPSRVDRRIPREVDAVVGPPEAEGLVDRVRHEVWPLSFLVSDAPMAEAGKRRLVSGAVLTLFGLVFTAFPLVWLFSGG